MIGERPGATGTVSMSATIEAPSDGRLDTERACRRVGAQCVDVEARWTGERAPNSCDHKVAPFTPWKAWPAR